MGARWRSDLHLHLTSLSIFSPRLAPSAAARSDAFSPSARILSADSRALSAASSSLSATFSAFSSAFSACSSPFSCDLIDFFSPLITSFSSPFLPKLRKNVLSSCQEDVTRAAHVTRRTLHRL